jgi:hypothetical protein
LSCQGRRYSPYQSSVYTVKDWMSRENPQFHKPNN